MGRLTNGSLLGEHQPSDLDLVDIEPPGALAGPVRGVAGACLPTPRLYATREDLRVHRENRCRGEDAHVAPGASFERGLRLGGSGPTNVTSPRQVSVPRLGAAGEAAPRGGRP